MKLLLVEDDQLMADLVMMGATVDGHVVEHVLTGEEALGRARTDTFDAIILDLNLPDMHGFDITEKLRSEGHIIPILMLTSESNKESIVKGLKVGADDYLTKPFDPQELDARLQAIMRRVEARTELIHIGPLSLDRLQHTILCDGKPMKLSPKEYKLLEYFMLRPDQVVARMELLDQIWGIRFDPGSNVVDVHIARLRTKLRRKAEGPQIETVRAQGFMLQTVPAPTT